MKRGGTERTVYCEIERAGVEERLSGHRRKKKQTQPTKIFVKGALMRDCTFRENGIPGGLNCTCVQLNTYMYTYCALLCGSFWDLHVQHTPHVYSR